MRKLNWFQYLFFFLISEVTFVYYLFIQTQIWSTQFKPLLFKVQKKFNTVADSLV